MKTRLAVAALLILGFAQVEAQKNLPRCNVGADPVNKDRQLVEGEELAINSADQKIRYETRGGDAVTCILQPGVPVAVDKITGVAKWVYGCGNNILTPFTPKRMSLHGERGEAGPPGPTGPQGIQGTPGSAGRNGRDAILPDYSRIPSDDYVVRRGGGLPGWAWALIGAGAVAAGYGIYELVDDNGHHGGPPHVTSDSAVVHTEKCVATGVPNNCPNPASSAALSRWGLTLNPVQKRVSIRISLPLWR